MASISHDLSCVPSPVIVFLYVLSFLFVTYHTIYILIYTRFIYTYVFFTQEKELHSSHILLLLAVRIENMYLIYKIEYKIIENWQSMIRYGRK